MTILYETEMTARALYEETFTPNTTGPAWSDLPDEARREYVDRASALLRRYRYITRDREPDERGTEARANANRLRIVIDEEFGLTVAKDEELLDVLEARLNERRKKAQERGHQVQAIHDLAAARLRNPPLDPHVEHDLTQIVKIAENIGAEDTHG